MVNNSGYRQLLYDVLKMPMERLMSEGNLIREDLYGNRLEICSIVNAKSGRCGEDCKFCSQSVHYNTNIEEYPMIEPDRIIKKGIRAKELGADRIGIVTSGNILKNADLEHITTAIRVLVREIGINVCGSLGALNKTTLKKLKDCGMSRYHHNIESSERFYPSIVSTHEHRQRILTIQTARETGLEVCSGGIIGMGENWEDRLEMALTLKRLNVTSVPLNFLIPIKGTPLQDRRKIYREEALRTIVLFRKVLEHKSIKIIAGREAVFGKEQRLLYDAGANGMLIDGYLTVPGRSLREDIDLITEIKKTWNVI